MRRPVCEEVLVLPCLPYVQPVGCTLAQVLSSHTTKSPGTHVGPAACSQEHFPDPGYNLSSI